MLFGRFDPFTEMDRLLSRPASNVWQGPMPIDIFRRGDEFVVQLDLPGVDPASIELAVEEKVLFVQAERHAHFAEGDQVLVAERPRGRFTRRLYLGDGLDAERIAASYDAGVLTVRVPVAESAKPRKIEITAGPRAKAIDTTAS